MLVDFSGPATTPVHDPVSQLVYATSAEQVREVWVAGRRLLEGGRLTSIDLSDVLARADEWAERLERSDRETGGAS